ncbi:helix-turn-helix domain-containing protein [Streptomyces sp. NPDC002328]|uniref:helix-turn-helix domain-containing protein n=1 Tax=Streptomyces sp. NPDC002328 TaxID=3364642 RepID=UPI00368028DA
MGGGRTVSATEFADLLREFKERSGLSYGTLAKRLHMSTSTLHRYCNGDAVPADYAPVERLARLCKAKPEELVELHRRWVLADAGRGKKGAGVAVAGEAADVSEATQADRDVEAPTRGPAGPDDPAGPDEGESSDDGDGDGANEGGAASGVRRRPRILAAVAAATALSAVALALSLTLPGGGSDDDEGARPAGNVSAQGKRGAESSVSPSVSVSSTTSSSPSPSAAGASPSGSPSTSAPAGGGAGPEAPEADDTAPPLTVAVRPYAWLDPCSPHYLVDKEPGRVSPPPLEQDAHAWVAAHGAVPSGEQMVEVTVQGTGAATVVVESLKVRTVQKSSPLAWNDFAMGYPGVGCGGGVPKRYFTVALDAVRPALLPEAGADDFPFSVSESDPEAYYVAADASAYDVRWVLELSWSSGSRRGTLTVDDDGKPFHTSGNNGRPSYEFPIGGSAWGRAGASPTP